MVEKFDTKINNIGLISFGIIVLVIGLIASFYPQVETFTTSWGEVWEVGRNYPYQNIGLILVIVGIIFVGIGYSSQNHTRFLFPQSPIQE